MTQEEFVRKKIGIIGINGKYGKWYNQFFERLGMSVMGSDLETEISSIDVVRESDVIILAVPIRQVCEIVKSLSAESRPDQLWIDTSGVKRKVMEEINFLNPQVEILGLHLMCKPPKTNRVYEQNIIVQMFRVRRWKDWTEHFLSELADLSCIKHSTAKDHDDNVAVTQAGIQSMLLAFAIMLKDNHRDVTELMKYSTPPFRALIAVIGNMLSQDEGLYADMLIENSEAKVVLFNTVNSLMKVTSAAAQKSPELFEQEFISCREFFGEEFIQVSKQTSQRLFKQVSDT